MFRAWSSSAMTAVVWRHPCIATGEPFSVTGSLEGNDRMNRLGIRASVALVSAFIFASVAPTPAQAATTADISAARLIADGSLAVTVSVSCDPLSESQAAIISVFLAQGEFGRRNYVEGFGFFGALDTNLLTCDGQNHTYTIVLEPDGASVANRFRAGRTSFAETVLQISTETSPDNFLVEPVSVVTETVTIRR